MSLELIEAARILRCTLEQWPETFTADLATALQSWRPDQDNGAWNIRCSDLRTLFRLAMKEGTVQVMTTTAKVPTQQRRVLSPGINRRWGDTEWPTQSRVLQPAQYKYVTTHHVTAAAFAAWLAANEQEPSRHAAAWFKAQGVHTAVAQPQATAPRETTAQRNNRWLLEWDRHGGAKKAGAQTRAIESIAASEGVNPETVKKAMKKAEQARIEGYREQGALPINTKKAKPASPFDGLTKKR